MRRLALVPALALAVLVSGSATASGKTAFTGEWIGKDDPGDGSIVHLYISGGTHANIKFTDEYGTVCENVGSPVTFFRSTITGTVEGDVLAGTMHSAHCGPVPVLFLRGHEVFYELDVHDVKNPADDTLWDGTVNWSRV